MNNPLADDLDAILATCAPLWEELRGARLFVTGGTGFFGCWLLESLCWANARLGLAARAVVLTRDPAAFARKAPHLASDPAVQCVRGDVRDDTLPPGPFTHVIHAATDADAAQQEQQPLVMFDTILDGTRRVLAHAAQNGAQQLLLTSSGAVYGPQPPELSHLPEEYRGGPDPCDVHAVYAEAKRAAELLGMLYAQQGLAVKIARGFAFVGPYLPLDRHFAAGNFLCDALHGDPIRVNGDGTPYRSYQYASDLTVWLWTILLRGETGRPYNVGEEDAVSIAELAHLIAALVDPPVAVHIARPPMPGQLPSRYVPSTTRARAELGLANTVPLADALARTLRWHQRQLPTPC